MIKPLTVEIWHLLRLVLILLLGALLAACQAQTPAQTATALAITASTVTPLPSATPSFTPTSAPTATATATETASPAPTKKPTARLAAATGGGTAPPPTSAPAGAGADVVPPLSELVGNWVPVSPSNRPNIADLVRLNIAQNGNYLNICGVMDGTSLDPSGCSYQVGWRYRGSPVVMAWPSNCWTFNVTLTWLSPGQLQYDFRLDFCPGQPVPTLTENLVLIRQ